MAVLQPGTRVHLVRGIYKGEHGTVVRTTPCKVFVQLAGKEKPIRKDKDCVEIVAISTNHVNEEGRGVILHLPANQSSHGVTLIDELGKPVTQPVVSDFPLGSHVLLLAGSHKGQRGVILRSTPCTVCVQIPGLDEPVRKYKKSVRIIMLPHSSPVHKCKTDQASGISFLTAEISNHSQIGNAVAAEQSETYAFEDALEDDGSTQSVATGVHSESQAAGSGKSFFDAVAHDEKVARTESAILDRHEIFLDAMSYTDANEPDASIVHDDDESTSGNRESNHVDEDDGAQYYFDSSQDEAVPERQNWCIMEDGTQHSIDADSSEPSLEDEPSVASDPNSWVDVSTKGISSMVSPNLEENRQDDTIEDFVMAQPSSSNKDETHVGVPTCVSICFDEEVGHRSVGHRSVKSSSASDVNVSPGDLLQVPKKRSSSCRIRAKPCISTRTPGENVSQNSTPGSNWRVRGSESVFHTFGGVEIGKIVLLPEPERKRKYQTFAHHLFGSRLLAAELALTQTIKNVQETNVPANLEHNGRQYQLLSSKLHKDCTGYFNAPRMRVTMQYVAVSGPDLITIDLQEELNKIGNFGALLPHKAAARLELFESPSTKCNIKARENLILDDISSADFEEIAEEGCYEGCGFIPKSYITRLVGNYAVGKRTMALQVRIFAPKIGIFKGMLVEKPGIDKIQLPPSMKKVLPSLVNGDDWACLLVTSAGRHPGERNLQIAKLLRGDPIPKTFTSRRLKDMIMRLWEGLGVPRSVCLHYAKTSENPPNLNHASLVGVADPTGCIPDGHIFVPGMAQHSKDVLFVTRYPCMELDDGHMLPVVTSKPRNMSNSLWSWLNTLHFGVIIFGNSINGRRPLPHTIANGDLDGDLYFVCWNAEILSRIQPVHTVLQAAVTIKDENEFLPDNPNWLEATQEQVRDIVTFVELHMLIGKLYSQANRIAKDSTSFLDDPDYRSLGRAYKRSMDLGKHGGALYLPAHLWAKIPERLHKYLTTEEDMY